MPTVDAAGLVAAADEAGDDVVREGEVEAAASGEDAPELDALGVADAFADADAEAEAVGLVVGSQSAADAVADPDEDVVGAAEAVSVEGPPDGVDDDAVPVVTAAACSISFGMFGP